MRLLRNTRKLIDANVILRYLVTDNVEMAMAAEKAIDDGAYTTAEVLAEVVYVLRGVYGIPKARYCAALRTLLEDIRIERKEAIVYALNAHECENLDFVDSILLARHAIYQEDVLTFDKKLKTALTRH